MLTHPILRLWVWRSSVWAFSKTRGGGCHSHSHSKCLCQDECDLHDPFLLTAGVHLDFFLIVFTSHLLPFPWSHGRGESCPKPSKSPGVRLSGRDCLGQSTPSLVALTELELRLSSGHLSIRHLVNPAQPHSGQGQPSHSLRSGLWSSKHKSCGISQLVTKIDLFVLDLKKSNSVWIYGESITIITAGFKLNWLTLLFHLLKYFF